MEFITPDDHITENSRSSKVVGVIVALLLTAVVTGGYFIIRKQYAEAERQRRVAATPAPAPAKPQASPVLEIQEDQAMLRGSQALLGGTVKNIGPSPLHDVAIELSLARRSDSAEERRAVPLDPKDLAPGETAKYSMLVSREFRSFRVSQVVEGNGGGESLAFKTLAGKRRPLEGPAGNNTVIVKKPGPKNGEEEFINTQDNPSRVP
jgi:hypothetical protein